MAVASDDPPTVEAAVQRVALTHFGARKSLFASTVPERHLFVDAVATEPVSTADSLLTGQLTGIFVETACFAKCCWLRRE
jgi:hypothetical protein